MRRILKYIFYFFLALIGLLFGYMVYVYFASRELPDHTKFKVPATQKVDSVTYTSDNCWLHYEQDGLWTLYAEGTPLEMGAHIGALTKGLIANQEKAFVNQIRRIIPSETYLRFLKYFIGSFNVNITDAIPNENKEEIYGISCFASPEYDFIAQPYQRILNYHGAHDIGHLLQNLGMVGCTSFGVWGDKTKDGNLLVARNFDFYVGDEFSKEKIVAFIRPDSGYCHAFITWGGMMGAVSGMNEKGLTVTINAANSDITFKTATPVSIVARQILQYAANTTEAIAIAGKFKVFVSEQFLIGSAEDNKAIVIEKTPKGQSVYFSTGNYLTNTNHFQSEENRGLEGTLNQKTETASGYRQQRLDELISGGKEFTSSDLAGILRDTCGITGASIGIGNELAINQMIAHHSVIFSPKERILWVSTTPHQIGKYKAFDLNRIFELKATAELKTNIDSLTIAADTNFLLHAYKKHIQFQAFRRSVAEGTLDTINVRSVIALNPDYYLTYETIGDYFLRKEDAHTALEYYMQASIMLLPGENEKTRITEKQKNCISKKVK